MKKFISLAGYSLVIASQIASTQALAKEVTSYDINGFHTREDWPNQTASRNLAFLNEGEKLNSADVACAKKQIAEIKKIAGDLDIDAVEINLEYGNRIQKGSYAQVKTEKPYKIPFFNKRVGTKKVLEVGVVMPYMPNGRENLTDCVIMADPALKKAVNQPGVKVTESAMLITRKVAVDLDQNSNARQSLNAWLECSIDLGERQKLNKLEKNCLNNVNKTNEAAVYVERGEKARAPASIGTSGQSSPSFDNASAQ